MKKEYLLLFILIWSNSLLSQSKSETKEWINRKYNSYLYNPPFNRDLKIGDNYFIYIERIGDAIYYKKIDINKINRISIRKFKGSEEFYGKNALPGYLIALLCKDNKDCIEEGTIENSKLIPYYSYFSDYRLKIYLDASFFEDDNPERMKKAILHLVELYGGKAAFFKDTF